MKLKSLKIICLLIVISSMILHAQTKLSGLEVRTASKTTEISQFGITWTFSEPVEYGTYVNGDYWVVGPVEIVSISPASVSVSGRIVNGSMVNPTAGKKDNGLDSESGAYNSSLNIAWNLSPSNSYIAKAGESILSSVSNLTPPELLETLAVLTVVGEIPEQNSFRPPYAGTNKNLSYSYNDINTTLLTMLPVVGIPPEWADVEKMVERPFIDFAPGWTRGDVHGNNLNNEHYGREVSHNVGVISLMLLSDYSLTEKRKTLIGFIQRGIDLWGLYQDYSSGGGGSFPWVPDGGHSSGRKWPILFAGTLLGDSQMQAIGFIPENFHEDAQTIYVDQDVVDITQSGMSQTMKDAIQTKNSTAWNEFVANFPDVAARTGEWDSDSRSGGFAPFTEAMIGLPEWYGAKKLGNVNADWRHLYRECCNEVTFQGMTLSVLVMGLRHNWNHDELFDYMYRYMAIESGKEDPFAVELGIPKVQGAPNSSGGSWRSFGPYGVWLEAMWDAYWNSYYSISDWRAKF